jgi:hypothetical protein
MVELPWTQGIAFGWLMRQILSVSLLNRLRPEGQMSRIKFSRFSLWKLHRRLPLFLGSMKEMSELESYGDAQQKEIIKGKTNIQTRADSVGDVTFWPVSWESIGLDMKFNNM